MAETPSSTALDERYEILGEISKGGMGVVYKANDRVLGKLVAVKILRPGQNVPGARRRFLNEAQLLRRISHPNIVEVHDFGTLNDGRNFLTMEYLSGPTLGGLFKTQPGRLEPLRACRIALQIARALIAVHDLGVIHRDLKPENVFLVERDGRADFVKLIDFGIAKDTINKDPEDSKGSSTGELAGLADESYSSETAKTKPGTALGSPRYMAPEQVRGGDIDARTDQYALGCMLYLMLVGAVPFDGTVPIEVMMAHVTKPVPPPRQRVPELRISDGLEQLVLRMLEKDRNQRFPSLREVETALQAEIATLEKSGSGKAEKAAQKSLAAATSGDRHASSPGHKATPIWPFLLGLVLLGGTATYLVRLRLSNGDFPLSAATQAEQQARQREAQTLGEASLAWARGALGDRNAAVREAGVAVLSDCAQKEALPLLAGMLDDTDASVRIAAAQALSRRPTPEPQALSALRLALRDSDARVLVAARSALLAFGDKDQRAQLRTLAGHSDAEVRRLLAVGAATDPAMRDVVERLMNDSDARVATTAARSMLRLGPGDARATDKLNAASDEKRKLEAAGVLPISVALPLIKKAAADADPAMRRLAAESVFELPAASPPTNPDVRIEILRGLITDRDPLVAARAKSILARILRQPSR